MEQTLNAVFAPFSFVLYLNSEERLVLSRFESGVLSESFQRLSYGYWQSAGFSWPDNEVNGLLRLALRLERRVGYPGVDAHLMSDLKQIIFRNLEALTAGKIGSKNVREWNEHLLGVARHRATRRAA